LLACETWLVGVAPLAPTSGNAPSPNVNQTEYVAGQTAATSSDGNQPAGPAIGLTDPTGAVESGIFPLATAGSNGKGNGKGGSNGGSGRQPGGGGGPTASPFSGFGTPNPSDSPLETAPPTDTAPPTTQPTDTPVPTPPPPPTDTPVPTPT
jgi:hypothetical protein